MAGIGPLVPYASYPEFSGDGTIDHDDNEFVALLLDSGHTPDLVGDTEISDVSGDELAEANGYARETLANVTWTRAANVSTFSADPVVFTADGGSITAAYLVIADNTSGKLVAIAPFLDGPPPGGIPADLVITAGNSVTLTPTTGFTRHTAVQPE